MGTTIPNPGASVSGDEAKLLIYVVKLGMEKRHNRVRSERAIGTGD